MVPCWHPSAVYDFPLAPDTAAPGDASEEDATGAAFTGHRSPLPHKASCTSHNYLSTGDLSLAAALPSSSSPPERTTPSSTTLSSLSSDESNPMSPLPPSEILWAAVLSRSRPHDTLFVYSVHSTKIYCRPTCPSRRPLRSSVGFFRTAREAEHAGFRACKRCKPEEASDPAVRRQRDAVRKAKRVLRRSVRAGAGSTRSKVGLDALAREVGVSAFHLHRCFKKFEGITPEKWVKRLRRDVLLRGVSVGDESDPDLDLDLDGADVGKRPHAETRRRKEEVAREMVENTLSILSSSEGEGELYI